MLDFFAAARIPAVGRRVSKRRATTPEAVPGYPSRQTSDFGRCRDHGAGIDMTAAIENQIERFVPGFRERILARSARGPAEIERHNANDIGGDINVGLQDLRQIFTRSAARLNPYSTPNQQPTLCSSSTPPGGRGHGMCGFHRPCAGWRAVQTRQAQPFARKRQRCSSGGST
ncbi:MAG: hypothetical protein ABI222_03250 [Opitutaceae bacterium]